MSHRSICLRNWHNQDLRKGKSLDAGSAEALWKSRHAALAEGVALSRELATEPANVIYPETFVERVRAEFGNTANVKIEVLDEPMMRKLGMG